MCVENFVVYWLVWLLRDSAKTSMNDVMSVTFTSSPSIQLVRFGTVFVLSGGDETRHQYNVTRAHSVSVMHRVLAQSFSVTHSSALLAFYFSKQFSCPFECGVVVVLRLTRIASQK